MDVPAFYVLLLVVLLNSIWNASSAVPLAANKHQILAIVYLICTSASLLIGYPMILHSGIEGAASALLLSEIGMGIFVLRMSNKQLSDQWPDFAASLVDPTQFVALFAKLKNRRN